MAVKIFIDGESGTTGLCIAERLASYPGITLLSLDAGQRKNPHDRRAMLDEADLAILCLPDEAAREAVSWGNSRLRILDASSAHRVHQDWTYGLPELGAEQAQLIGNSQRVSNAGCYASAALLLLRPLIADGLLPADSRVVIQGFSGYSGGGRAMIERVERGEDTPFMRLYALSLEHKHLPEITRYSGLRHPPIFIPAVGGFPQGMIVTIGLFREQLSKDADVRALWQSLSQAYRSCPLVSLAPLVSDDQVDLAVAPLNAESMAGRDDISLSCYSDRSGDRYVLAAQLDNLGKGAAGCALQNLSLMLG